MGQQKHIFEMQLNSVTDTDNPAKKEVSFILHDFSVSHNHTFIKKETAEKVLDTIQNTPIVCQYFPVSSVGANDDALGSHGVIMDRDRDTGETFVTMNTLPIGVFTEPAYITTIIEDGVEKEVVAAKGVLWQSRFPNIVSLIKQWFDEGIRISSSMEILYDKYSVENGVTEIQNFLYEGHCILNSEKRGNRNKVAPAYDVSKLTKLVAEALNIEHKEEEQMPEQEIEVVEVEEVVDTPETIETAVEETEEQVETVETTEEVVEEIQEPSELEQLQNQYNQLKNDYEELQKQFNTATETLTQLNTLVKELEPIKIQFETEKLEKAISEKMDFYAEKFTALNAKEKFETDEVKELIRISVNETDEGRNAVLQLNTMLVELVQSPIQTEVTVVREVASKRENLLPAENSFESRYSI